MKHKPTNKAIADYIYDWIISLDGDGLILVDPDAVKKTIAQATKLDWKYLRKLFGQE